MSVRTNSTRCRSAMGHSATLAIEVIRLSLDIRPARFERLFRDTTNVQAPQRTGQGGKSVLLISMQAAGGRASPREGFRFPRWLTAEHPLPWLLPMTALIVACGIYPLLYSVWLSFQER